MLLFVQKSCVMNGAKLRPPGGRREAFGALKQCEKSRTVFNRVLTERTERSQRSEAMKRHAGVEGKGSGVERLRGRKRKEANRKGDLL